MTAQPIIGKPAVGPVGPFAYPPHKSTALVNESERKAKATAKHHRRPAWHPKRRRLHSARKTPHNRTDRLPYPQIKATCECV